MPTPTNHLDDLRTTRALIARRYIITVPAGVDFEQDLYATPIGVVIDTIAKGERRPCQTRTFDALASIRDIKAGLLTPWDAEALAGLSLAITAHIGMWADAYCARAIEVQAEAVVS